MNKILLLTLLITPLLASANTCFWNAEMRANGNDEGDAFDYEQNFLGFNNAYASDVMEFGYARETGFIVLTTNEASARTSFAVDPTNRTIRVYSNAEVFQNPVQATEAASEVALRDYYQAQGSEALEIRVSYDFNDWYHKSGAAYASMAVFAQAYKTDGQVYSIHNGFDNIAEGIFFINSEDHLPYDNMLAYESAQGDHSGFGLSDITYTFSIDPDEIVALDTLVGVWCNAGKWLGDVTGEAYGGTQDGTRPGWSGPSSFDPFHVRYTVEVISGSGTFEPYSYTIPAPEPAGKMEPGQKPGELNLVLAGEDGITYQVETSTNLVDWTTWFYQAGRGGSIERSIDPSGTNACFYRITPIKK